MRTDDFDYDLPSGLIAQEPAQPRDSCRLLVLDRASGQVDHRVFTDIVDYLADGDVLVVNETRVLPARLKGVKDETGGAVEVLLLRERYTNAWECLVKPGRRLKPGAKMVFADGAMTGLVVETIDEGGGRLVQFTLAAGSEASSTSCTASARCRCRPTSRAPSTTPSSTRPSSRATSAPRPRPPPACISRPSCSSGSRRWASTSRPSSSTSGIDTFRPGLGGRP